MSDKAEYRLDHVGDADGFWCVSEHPGGRVRAILSRHERQVLTQNGWTVKPHLELRRVEVEGHRVLLWCGETERPECLDLPDVEPGAERLAARHVELVLRQMREKSLVVEDAAAEWADGMSTTYAWDAARDSFLVTRVDTISGGFLSEREIDTDSLKRELLLRGSLQALRDAGFSL